MRRNIPSTQAPACFEVAARHESYTCAAQELSLTQSAVSRQIQALEEFWACNCSAARAMAWCSRLRARTTGARWRAGCRVSNATRSTSWRTRARAARCRWRRCPRFATRWLCPRLPQLARQHPDIVVHIETQTRPFLFADTTFDAALYAGTAEQVANWPGIRRSGSCTKTWCRCSPQLLEPSAHRGQGRAYQGVAAEALAGLPLLQQSTRPYGWRQWFEAMGVERPMPSMVRVTSCSLCWPWPPPHGLGVALIPPLLIEAELASGELVVACARPLRGERATISSAPRRHRRPCWRPSAPGWRPWQVLAHRASSYKRPFGSKVSSLQIDGQQKGQMACNGISAVRYDARQGPCITEVLMGLLAADGRCWESAPVPVPLVEVVDRSARGRPHRRRARGPPAAPSHGVSGLPAGEGQPPLAAGRMHQLPGRRQCPALHDLPMFSIRNCSE